MIHRSIYSFESVFLNRKKGKVMKAFPLNILKLDYDHRERKVKTFALMIKLWACKTTSVQIQQTNVCKLSSSEYKKHVKLVGNTLRMF